MTCHTTTPAADQVGGTIDYLRRCAGRKLLEASLTPEMCREIVQTIDHLEAERDAALAEVDRITEAGRVHIRRAAAFEAQRDELKAELERAREVLRGVEWCELPHAYYGVAMRCPHCGGLRSSGHDPECQLSAALAAKGE